MQLKSISNHPIFTLFTFTLWIATSSSTVAPLHGQAAGPLAPVQDKYPSWSPDGEKIVFQSNRMGAEFQLFTMRTDGTDVRQITFPPGENQTPVWSPDGTEILFESTRDGNTEIYTVRVDGSKPRNLTRNPAGDNHPKYGPEGRSIIFNSNRVIDSSLYDLDYMSREHNHEIFLMETPDSVPLRLTAHEDWDTYPSLSPDGRMILWRRVLREGDEENPLRNSEIFLARRNGSEAQNVTQHSAFDGWPAWSPDGEWIAFASNRDGHNRDFNLYLIRPDGADIRKLTETLPGIVQARPAWSPHGNRILFNRGYRDGRIEIHILTVDGT